MQEDIKKEIKKGYLEMKRHSIIARDLNIRTIEVTNIIKQYEEEWGKENILRKLPKEKCDLCGCVVYGEKDWKDLTDTPTRDFVLSNAITYLSKKAVMMFRPKEYDHSSVCVGCAIRFAEQHIFDGYYQDKSIKLKEFEQE